MAKRISIIGGGWLGLPLAEHLASLGHSCKVTCTQTSKFESIKALGCKPFLLKLTPELEADNIQEFLNSDILIINIPPKAASMGKEFHIQQISHLLAAIPAKNLLKVIYTSSTSVYPNKAQLATENSEVDQSSTLIQVENLLAQNFENLVILRLAGLMGYDRYTAKYYMNKAVPKANQAVNYIHRDDVIAIITLLLERDLWNKTYNICAPMHPSRKEVVLQNCHDKHLAVPLFEEGELGNDWKIISAQQFDKDTQYEYQYPDPRYFI